MGKEFPLSQPVRANLIPLHCVIRFLARRPSYSPLVGDSSIELSSLSNPAEHVGSHSGGVLGCLAELGSDGIAGVTTALLSCCEALLQALKSTTSALSISTRCSQLFLCLCICFLRCGLSRPTRARGLKLTLLVVLSIGHARRAPRGRVD